MSRAQSSANKDIPPRTECSDWAQFADFSSASRVSSHNSMHHPTSASGIEHSFSDVNRPNSRLSNSATTRRRNSKSRQPKISEEVRLLVQALKNTTIGAGEETYAGSRRNPPTPAPSARLGRGNECKAFFNWFKNKQNFTRNIPSRNQDDMNTKIADFMQTNADIRQLFGAIVDKSEQLNKASMVLNRTEDRLHTALAFLFEEESPGNVERFMELFETFASEMGVDERTLLSHFENRNYLFEVGIHCLKEIGIREPQKCFAQFLKDKSHHESPAFYVYKTVGVYLENGESPNLERPQPYRWEEFHDLYAEFIDSAGVPDDNLVKYCARRVFEEGIITLKERGVTDPVKRFVEFVHLKQSGLKGMWKKISDIFSQCVADERPSRPFSKNVAFLDNKLFGTKRKVIIAESPIISTRSDNGNTTDSSVYKTPRCSSATLSLASMASPRQVSPTSPRQASPTRLNLQSDMGGNSVIEETDDEHDDRESIAFDDLDAAKTEFLLSELAQLRDADECDFFGKMISCCLRSIPDEKIRQQAQLKMQKVLYDFRFHCEDDVAEQPEE